MEEEAYYEAKREAARAAKMQKQKEVVVKANAGVIRNGPNAWLEDETEWDMYVAVYYLMFKSWNQTCAERFLFITTKYNFFLP